MRGLPDSRHFGGGTQLHAVCGDDLTDEVILQVAAVVALLANITGIALFARCAVIVQ